MNNTPSTLESLSPQQLDAVTGGGIISTIGGLFGPKGAKIGGIADTLFGLFKGGGAGGGLSALGSLFGGGSKNTSAAPSASPGGDAGG